MPYADPVRQKAHLAKMARNRRERARLEVQELKAKNPCSDCGGFFHFSAMDFDHRDAQDKRVEISRIIGRGVCWTTLRAELEKCDLVCANCHRVREYERREYARTA